MDQSVGRVLTDLLPYTLTGIASPAAIMAEIVILTSKHGRTNAWLFVLGWFLGMLAVGWGLLLLSDGVAFSPTSGTSTTGSILHLLAGALFLGLAWFTWRRSVAQTQSDRPAKPPKWMQGLDQLTALRALGLGALLGTVLAPANLVADFTTVAHIVQADVVQGQRYLTYLIFSVISLLGGIVPVLIATLLGESVQGRIVGVDFVSKALGGLIG